MTVYVVDTGVMASHTEFKANQVTAGYDAATATGLYPDEPGMTASDPCRGWPAR